jgi:capping protein beta
MRRLPPQNVEENLNKLLSLVHPDLADELLSAIDQPLKLKRCVKTGKEYLICDYNRDGDSYRYLLYILIQRQNVNRYIYIYI